MAEQGAKAVLRTASNGEPKPEGGSTRPKLKQRDEAIEKEVQPAEPGLDDQDSSV